VPENPLDVVATERLDLVLLPRDWLAAIHDGNAAPDLGFTDPFGFLADEAELVAIRLDQLAARPADAPWLLRAIVLRDTGAAVGHVNFHGAPDERGAVEIGYTVVPEMRRHGIARETARGMWHWAAVNGATVLRASVAPDNEPSQRLIRAEGFSYVGDQIDEIDGVEQVFERPVR